MEEVQRRTQLESEHNALPAIPQVTTCIYRTSGVHPHSRDVSDRLSRRYLLCRLKNCAHVQPIGTVEFRQIASLTKRIHAQRADALPLYRSEPAERGRVAVDDAHDTRRGRNTRKQPFNMAARARMSAFAGSLRRCPARVQPVRGCHREHADIEAVLRHKPGRLDRLGRDNTLIGHHHVTVRPRLAQPVCSIDNEAFQLRRHFALRLVQLPG